MHWIPHIFHQESKMKKVVLTAATLATILFAAGVCAKDFVVQELNNGPGGTFVFSPSFVQIQPGDTVTFTPTDQGHNSESVFAPAGATPWKTDVSQAATITFSKPGVYIYQCTPHNLFGMIGVIVVGSPVNLADAQKAAADIEKKQLMNQGRMSQIMKQVKQ
jgi:pseudoazurin